MSSIAFAAPFGKSPFEKVTKTFLDDPTLHFTQVLPKEVIEQTFEKYEGLFGGTYYNTVFVLWAFLLQTLSDEKHRSCSTAVARIVAFCVAAGKSLPDEDTGNYCRARAKLKEKALHELVTLVAKNTAVVMPSEWLWKQTHHAKLVDGFTATMPDTAKNRARFPKHGKSPPGAMCSKILRTVE